MRTARAVNSLFAVLVMSCWASAGSDLPPVVDGGPGLASPYQACKLTLGAFRRTPRSADGVILHARINGAKPMRFLLDSGADNLVMDSKAAHALGLDGDQELELVGPGTRPARSAWARSVEIGPVAFRHCRVALVDGKVIDGVDGVLPLSLFSDFLLRLDLGARSLELIPYPDARDLEAASTPRPGRPDPLLVATVLNGDRHGYAVLDTGAFCSAVSRDIARMMGGSHFAPYTLISAGTGAAFGRSLSFPVSFRVGNQELISDEAVALDLSNLSRHSGVEVIGVVGFPALRPYVLTIDYRHGFVTIRPPEGHAGRKSDDALCGISAAQLAFH